MQGEVESIAQMKPKGNEHEEGLLEYLEDIIGTSRYKTPIEDAMAEMERLGEERAEKLSRLRIVEKEKEKLEEKKKEAEDFLRLQNDLVKMKSRLWQFYLWRCLENDEKFARKIVSQDLPLFSFDAQELNFVTGKSHERIGRGDGEQQGGCGTL